MIVEGPAHKRGSSDFRGSLSTNPVFLEQAVTQCEASLARGKRGTDRAEASLQALFDLLYGVLFWIAFENDWE